MAKPTFPGFPADTMRFLKELKQNNERDWFATQKDRYERVYVEPTLAFIDAIAPLVKKASPFLLAIPKKTGGSMIRIYRDTRFSPDPTPYKTHIGIQFRHEAGKNIHAPGIYVHIEPGNVFMGAGMWRPDRDPLLWVRERIANHPDLWKRTLNRKKFRETYQMTGDSLKRPPKGFDKEHPMIEEIKRKDFIAVTELDPKTVETPEFPRIVADRIRTAEPLMMFLCDALELSY